MDEHALSISQERLAEFCRRYQIRRLALFGSALQPERLRPDSDLDLLVSFQPGARVTFLKLGRMKRELSALFQRPVDLVPQEGLKPAIRDAILSSARELYAQ